MARSLILPHYSRTKSVGHITEYNLRSNPKSSSSGVDTVTTKHLERTYHETGLKTFGPCEVRTAWKYNDLKPRVYYAMGGDAYFASRYIRNVANSLCDILPPSRRNTRYNTSRIRPITSQSSVFIYDYSSFTSNLSELKYFLAELAEWCKDTTVRLVDTHEGIIQCSLGDLLASYNTDVNINAELDLSRVFHLSHPERPLLEAATKNGMLGVYGNIVLSTFLHGLFLTFTCGSDDLCNVVGDDAIGVTRDEEWSMPDILDTVRLLGDVAEEKQETWVGEGSLDDSHGWQFLKRPLDRLANNLFVGILFDLPLAIYVDPPADDGVHTQELGGFQERIRSFLMQTCRLLTRMHHLEHKLSEEEIEFGLQYLRTCFRRLHLPQRGAMPPVSHPRLKFDLDLAIPIIARESVSRPWHELLVEESMGQGSTLPRHTFHTVEPEVFRHIGQEFDASSNRLLDLLVDLGYCTRRLQKCYVAVNADTARCFVRFMEGEHTLLYTYEYTSEPPMWWRRALSLCSQ